MNNIKKRVGEEINKKQSGLIKELVIIIAVIATLAYFEIDPKNLWSSVTGFFK